jgi:hypothetical protein
MASDREGGTPAGGGVVVPSEIADAPEPVTSWEEGGRAAVVSGVRFSFQAHCWYCRRAVHAYQDGGGVRLGLRRDGSSFETLAQPARPPQWPAACPHCGKDVSRRERRFEGAGSRPGLPVANCYAAVSAAWQRLRAERGSAPRTEPEGRRKGPAAAAPDLDELAAHVETLGSEGEVVAFLDADPRVTVAVLRELARRLGVTIPSSARAKAQMRRLIARNAVGFPRGRGGHPRPGGGEVAAWPPRRARGQRRACAAG